MTTQLMPTPKQQWFNNAGLPLVGGFIYTFAAGTNAPKDTYIDSAGVTAQANPIVLNARGEPANAVYWDGAYKVVVYDSLMSLVYSVDNFIANANGGNTGTAAIKGTWWAGVIAYVSDLGTTIGSSLLGFIQAGVGAIGRSVESKLRDMVHIRDFGTLGGADDAAIWQLAINSGHRTIDARGVVSTILSQVNGASNQTILLNGASITTGGTALKTFSYVSKNNFNIVGPFNLTGDLVVDPGTGVTSAGIYIEDCTKWRIDRPTITNIKGSGIYLSPGANVTVRSDHGTVNSPRISGCEWGWTDIAGTGAEYCTVIGAHVSGCINAGIRSAAGNICWLGGHCLDNILDGVVLSGGANHLHGMFVGMNINHNGRYNLYAAAVTNGQDFIGCHFYANDAIGNGSIFLELCKGIHITGGHLDCQIYNYAGAGSGENRIDNMYCPGSYGVARRVGGNNGHYQLLISNCWGPGSYTVAGGGVDATGVTINDPSACGFLAQRNPASTQALVSGVAATLLWDSELFDRRNAFDPATGIFTVPSTPTQAGLYQFKFDCVFGGTAMNAAASYVAIALNGATIKFFFTAPYGTTKLSASGSFEIYLAAGDAVKVTASITGTTPVFGDGSVLSNFSALRLA